MKKSYIADNIMREYRKQKQYEDNKKWSEMQNYIKVNENQFRNVVLFFNLVYN